MSIASRIQLIPRNLKADSRGWFLKVIDGKEKHLPSFTGEVYLTLAEPGQIRGNHYHTASAEWFTVVQGLATVYLSDPTTGEQHTLELSTQDPLTLYVPAGIAHAFKNPEDATIPMLMVAYTDQLYNPEDTISFILI